MRRPAFMFYAADWRKDLELRSCSIAARGLWVELLAIMHEAKPYGHLVLGGKPMPEHVAAKMCAVDVRTFRRLLAELLQMKVPSIAGAGPYQGAIVSRRMVRDEAVRLAKAKGGQLGASHGAKGKKHGVKGGRPKSGGGLSNPPIPTNSKPPLSVSVSVSPSGSIGSLTTSVSGADAPDVSEAPGRQESQQDIATRVLGFLNDRAGKRFPATDTNVGVIVARLREGFTEAQIRQVIAMRIRKWKGDERMHEYLRPTTLFGRQKFSNYVGELVEVVEPAAEVPGHDRDAA